jgi:hypothetical protein
MTTREGLGIFWIVSEANGEGELEKYHKEVDGFTIHSLWREEPDDAIAKRVVKKIKRIWPQGAIKVHPSPVFAEEYSDLCIDVRVLEWPNQNEWMSILERTLKFFCDLGAKVAWIGIEGSFAWPRLFEPDTMKETVYAAYMPSHGLLVGSSLDEELRFLSREEMSKLRETLRESGAV